MENFFLILPVPTFGSQLRVRMYSLCRKPIFTMSRRMPDGADTYGGVCGLVRKSLHAKLCPEWCSPDILVLQIGDMHFVNAYVAGENSSAARNFADWQALHPRDTFSVVIKEMTDAGLAFSVHGDLNGRVGARCPHCEEHPPRIADDLVENNQGRWLIDLCNKYGLRMVNGCTTIPGNHHGFTFFGRVDNTSDKGKSTVDYVLLSPAAASRLSRMDIAAHRPDCSDHAATRAVIWVKTKRAVRTPQHTGLRRRDLVVPRDDELDEDLRSAGRLRYWRETCLR
ncbi:hypothetical protein C8F01DRAFT_1098690 [Mycena amicta]|nr:hypothetical protein C8F01DRAFT_1098690 [Mycena amicta]